MVQRNSLGQWQNCSGEVKKLYDVNSSYVFLKQDVTFDDGNWAAAAPSSSNV